MKILILLILFFTLFITYVFIEYDEVMPIKKEHYVREVNPKVPELEKLHAKFLNLDINDKNLDLDKLIKELKEARKSYPLDDKLKMLEMEVEDKKVNLYSK